MEALRHHFAHHRLHMLGCVVGGVALVAGGVFELPLLAIGGAIVCGAFCLDMIRTMLPVRLKRS